MLKGHGYRGSDTAASRMAFAVLAVIWLVGLLLIAGFWEPRNWIQWAGMIISIGIWSGLVAAGQFLFLRELERK